MKKRPYIWCLIVFCTLFGFVWNGARADELIQDEGIDFGRPGFYFGLGGLYAPEHFDRNVLPDESDNGIGIDFRMGYRVTRFVAAELDINYTAFDRATDSTIEDVLFNGTLNLKVYPFDWRVQPYLSAGAGVMFIDEETEAFGNTLSSDGSDFIYRAGGGVEIYFPRYWSANRHEAAFDSSVDVVMFFEYARIMSTGDMDGLDHSTATIGFLFRF